ncbi:cytochrome c [Rhodovulum sp. 12E13]|nr:cytochrome c [Rhodovulum sp. 12E13]
MAAAVAALAGGAAAQQAGPSEPAGDPAGYPTGDPTGPEAGRVAFLEACAGCHGREAGGDGPTAELLTVEVPDLTRFAARNAGTYDIARVIQTVDGRQGLAAHGGPMPMFGGLLTGPAAVVDGPGGAPVATTEPILAIARWLETVQEDTP